MVANEGLEKAEPINQVPRDRQLYIPSEGCGVNFQAKTPEEHTYSYFRVESSQLLGEKENLSYDWRVSNLQPFDT